MTQLPWKGMIFAAGYGTRLRPLTKTTPKALIEVGGVPLLERIITLYRDAGIIEIVINTHALADQITAFLEKNNFFDITIQISYESTLLDTGGN